MTENRNETYLKETECINHKNPLIQEKAAQLKELSESKLDYIKKAYEFVRDEIPHSWDIKAAVVSQKASEVLKNKTGICWTKPICWLADRYEVWNLLGRQFTFSCSIVKKLTIFLLKNATDNINCRWLFVVILLVLS